MTTTLRVNDELYRKAKAEAAKEGITLTRFIEEALELRLQHGPKAQQRPVELPSFAAGAGFDFNSEELKRLIEETQLEHDLEKIRRD